MATLSAMQALKARLEASRAAQPAGTQAPALIPQAAIQQAAQVQATPQVSEVEASLLAIPQDMRALEKFDPLAFVTKLANLRQQIEAKAPGVAQYMQEINKNLNQYPELAHLLNDSQLAALTAGLFFLTDTKIAEAVMGKKSGKKVFSESELNAMF